MIILFGFVVFTVLTHYVKAVLQRLLGLEKVIAESKRDALLDLVRGEIGLS